MELSSLMLLVVWVALVFIVTCLLLFWKILPKYHMIKSEVTFQELLLALNAAIQTEFDLCEKDVFVNKHAITNSNFDNYYFEMTDHILKSLSPIFFINIGKYITEDDVVYIIGRKTKEYLNTKISGEI